MTPRAADCAACEHWREGEENERTWLSEGILSQWRILWFVEGGVVVSQPFHASADGHWFACMQAHRPRFYTPRTETDPDWGWKRRCSDFERREEGKDE